MREPTKVLYEQWDANPDQEFDLVLCKDLGWRSVEIMREQMDMQEWMQWRLHYMRVAQRNELVSLGGR